MVIAGLCAAVGTGILVALLQGPPLRWVPLLVVLALSLVGWGVGSLPVAGSNVSFFGVVLLAAAVVLGPAAAGLLGVLVAALARERQPTRARLFNLGNVGAIGLVGGLAYADAGGVVPQFGDSGWTLVLDVGLPLAIATAAQAVTNVALIIVISRVAAGVPIRIQMQRILVATAASYVAYGFLAFLVIVLWVPAGVGVFSVLLIVVPLLGAKWAFLQYVEQRRSQEESLDLLVAAVEARRPHLAGHVRRAAALAAYMGEASGLTAAEANDVRRAGMLFDVTLVAVAAAPPDLAKAHLTDADRTTTSRMVRPGEDLAAGGLLADLGFLKPASRIAAAACGPPPRPHAAELVLAADRYDLLTTAAGGLEEPLSRAEAIARLAGSGTAPVVLHALEEATLRPLRERAESA